MSITREFLRHIDRRDPILSANAILSLDLLSQGRITLGVGAGFAGRSEPEFAFTGVAWARRRARLDDIVASSTPCAGNGAAEESVTPRRLGR